MQNSDHVLFFFFQYDIRNSTTVTAACYKTKETIFLGKNLVDFTSFQYDSVNSHTTRVSITTLKEPFLNHIIYKNGQIT